MTAVDTRGNAHLERVVEAFLVKRVRLVGGYAFKFPPVVAGLPDRIVLLPGGLVFFVELKQKGLRPSPVQQVWHQRLRNLGHSVVVLDSKEAVIDWLRRIIDSLGPYSDQG